MSGLINRNSGEHFLTVKAKLLYKTWNNSQRKITTQRRITGKAILQNYSVIKHFSINENPQRELLLYQGKKAIAFRTEIEIKPIE